MDTTESSSLQENSNGIISNSTIKDITKGENTSNKNPRKKIKYRIDFSNIIKKFRSKSDSEDEKYLSHIECYCNILMLSPNINQSNIISFLSLISYLNYRKKNKSVTYYLNSKCLKYLETQKGIESFIYIRNLYRAAVFLNDEESNIIYANKYITEIDLLSKNSKIDSKSLKLQNELRARNANSIKNYTKIYYNIYSNPEILTNENYRKLKKIINDIKNNQYNLDEEKDSNEPSNETNNDDNYLYAINKKWVIKAKNFLDDYCDIRENNKKCSYFTQIFDYNYFIDSYFNKDKKKDKFDYVAFPGHIDNYDITDFKDAWEDPVNEDENYFIKKNLELNKDYLLLTRKDFFFLGENFSYTNIIKRKRNINEFISIKGIIFDQRLSDEESNIYLRKRNIQIYKNSTVKDLKNKIFRCINYILNKKNTDNNGKNSESNIEKNTNNMNNSKNINKILKKTNSNDGKDGNNTEKIVNNECNNENKNDGNNTEKIVNNECNNENKNDGNNTEKIVNNECNKEDDNVGNNAEKSINNNKDTNSRDNIDQETNNNDNI